MAATLCRGRCDAPHSLADPYPCRGRSRMRSLSAGTIKRSSRTRSRDQISSDSIIRSDAIDVSDSLARSPHRLSDTASLALLARTCQHANIPISSHLSTIRTCNPNRSSNTPSPSGGQRLDGLFDPTADMNPDSPLSDLDGDELRLDSSIHSTAINLTSSPHALPLSLTIWDWNECMDIWDARVDASAAWPAKLLIKYPASRGVDSKLPPRLEVHNIRLTCKTIDLYSDKIKRVLTRRKIYTIPYIPADSAGHNGGVPCMCCIHMTVVSRDHTAWLLILMIRRARDIRGPSIYVSMSL